MKLIFVMGVEDVLLLTQFSLASEVVRREEGGRA